MHKLEREHGDAMRRITGCIPEWVLKLSFAQACASTSARDATEYARRFRRLRVFVETHVHCADDAAPSWMTNGCSVEKAVALARLSLGAALESCAQVASLNITPTSQLPNTAERRETLARLTADAYWAAVWTDMHADFLIELSVDLTDIADDDLHFSTGAPCMRTTTCVTSMPNLAQRLERYLASPASVDADSREVLNVLCRSTQAGARGWDVAVSAALSREASRCVLVDGLRSAMMGMHPQLHAAARPDWARRASMRRLFDSQLSASDWDAVLKANHAGLRESTRIYGCSILALLPATQAALARSGSPIGLLRSAPYELVSPNLQAAAQALVAASVDATHSITQLRLPPLLALQQALRLNLTPGDDVLCAAHAQGASTALVRSHSPTNNRAFFVFYNTGWMGRAASQEAASYGDGPTGNVPSAVCVVSNLLTRTFRAAFTPLWMHAHGHGVRAARLDPVQFNVMHYHSSSHQLLLQMEEGMMLRVQRLALRRLDASRLSIVTVLRMLRASASEVARASEARTLEDAIAVVCTLSADIGARLVLFAKVTALKHNFLAFDLGPRSRAKQLEALRRRYEVAEDVRREDVVVTLPEHAHLMYSCLECGKRPNACVDSTSKTISHNEVGVAQSMMRVGSLNDVSRMRCARRSSAALRTAMGKEDNALKARIDSLPVTESSIGIAMEENGNTTHSARLRRDTKSVMQQLYTSYACGDRPLVEVSLIGKVVRRHNRFFALCSYCAAILEVTPQRRFGGEICCGRCDAAMLGISEPTAPAARVASKPTSVPERSLSERAEKLVSTQQLHCRFCAKAPPSSGTSKFRVYHSPTDDGGRNAHLPPPLRVTAWCNSHNRTWLQGALHFLPMNVIFAHVSERAVPVFGANHAKRELSLLVPALQRSSSKKTHKSIRRRMSISTVPSARGKKSNR
jgi:hypothetical protein